MSIWATAGAAIDAAFADPEPVVYTGAGLVGAPLRAIRSDGSAPDFTGAGRTLGEASYEFRQADLPQEPRKEADSFIHRGRVWHVQQVDRDDTIGKWRLNVTDGGPA